MLTPTSRTTPQAALEIILDTMPLHLFIQLTGLNAYNRLGKQLDIPWRAENTMARTHLQFWEDYTEKAIGNMQDDRCRETIWTRKVNINLESFNGNSKYIRHSEYTIYTDGSKLKSDTGTG